MIWRSVVNILWALVRNAFQKGHQCIRLEKTTIYNGEDPISVWVWECSCSPLAIGLQDNEAAGIEDFQQHIRSNHMKTDMRARLTL